MLGERHVGRGDDNVQRLDGRDHLPLTASRCLPRPDLTAVQARPVLEAGAGGAGQAEGGPLLGPCLPVAARGYLLTDADAADLREPALQVDDHACSRGDSSAGPMAFCEVCATQRNASSV